MFCGNDSLCIGVHRYVISELHYMFVLESLRAVVLPLLEIDHCPLEISQDTFKKHRYKKSVSCYSFRSLFNTLYYGHWQMLTGLTKICRKSFLAHGSLDVFPLPITLHESLRAVVLPLHENDHGPLEYCQDSF